jgi:hypothetical protein
MPQDRTLVRAKGHVFSARLKFIDQRIPQKKANVLQALSPEFREQIAKGFLPLEWYPFAWLEELITAIDRFGGSADGSLAEEVGYFTAKNALNSVVKVFLRLGSPEFTLSRAAKVWGIHVDTGTMKVEFPGPKQFVVHLFDFPEPAHAYCRNLAGWARGTLEMCGIKGSRIQLGQCWHTGAHSHIECRGEWQ